MVGVLTRINSHPLNDSTSPDEAGSVRRLSLLFVGGRRPRHGGDMIRLPVTLVGDNVADGRYICRGGSWGPCVLQSAPLELLSPAAATAAPRVNESTSDRTHPVTESYFRPDTPRH